MDLETNIKNAIDSKKRTEEICKNIIKKIEEKYYTYFDVEAQGYTYGEMLQVLLLYPKFEQYQAYLLFLLLEYRVQEHPLILRLVNLLFQRNLPPYYRKYIEDTLMNLPYFRNIRENNGVYEIQTTVGDFKVENLENHVDFKTKKSIEDPTFQGKCHEAVQMLIPYFKTSDIVTSELSDLFGGYFYHSYFLDGEQIFDISNHTYYDHNVLKDVFQAQEIMKMPTSVFEEKVKTIGSMKYAPVLQLAIQEKNKS